MKRTKNILPLIAGFVICLIALTSFSNMNAKTPPDLAGQLIGEWRNVSVKVNIHNKVKPAIIMEADSSNWEVRLGIKPIRTHFINDGTYYSEYRNTKDSLVRRPSGTWRLKGDSLTMAQQLPDKSTLTVQVKINGDHATFHGFIDFDGEGVANDEYLGVQKRFK